MAEKKRFDYSRIGLAKVDGTTTFWGKGVNDLTEETVKYLANYGLFVVLTRTLAGNEKKSDHEKTEIVNREMKWLLDGMPKRERKTESPEDKAARIKAETIKAMRAAVENGTVAEKRMVEQIISKM